jgi:hypothetical protein
MCKNGFVFLVANAWQLGAYARAARACQSQISRTG